MSKQAQIGIFAILALLLLFGIFYVITDFGTRHTGYRVGIHFNSAAGLSSGALVYFSGVTVGSVDSIQLLPDNTVDVILAVNKDVDIPRTSKFLIQAPLTGNPSLVIVPPVPQQRPSGVVGPTPAPAAVPLLERRVLAVDQQAQGQNSATIADLLQEGQGEVKRLDLMLSDLQTREPRLLNTLQATMNNANDLTQTANRSVAQLSSQARQIADSLQGSIGTASSNIVDLTNQLDATVATNGPKVNQLLTTLNSTAVSLNASVDSLKGLATNKELKQNLIDTTRNIADTSQTIAGLTKDLRTITDNPQTQGQLRDTVAQLDAATQKANSLLGTLGGSSHVYGVDPNATPYPATLPTGAPGSTRIPPAGVPPVPDARLSPSPNSPARIKRSLGGIVKNLYAIQIRLSELSKQNTPGSNLLLSSDRGPQSDFNLLLLPSGNTSFLVGANDLGAKTSFNFAGIGSFGKRARIGGGILYSRLGLLAQYNQGLFGLEGRAYDLRRPTLDLYGNFNLNKNMRLFLGQRDLSHPERRTVFGLELQF